MSYPAGRHFIQTVMGQEPIIDNEKPRVDNFHHYEETAMKEASVYASIRQAKAKTGTAEELASRIKEGAIPIISDVEGFRAYYVVYAPDDTVTAISIFNDYAEPRSQTGACSRGSGRV
jgi:phosphoserine aminotransferase